MKKFVAIQVFAVLLGLIAIMQPQSPPSVMANQIEKEVANGGSLVRYVGPFTNTTLGLTGSVLIDLNVEPTTVSGYINFTDGPDVAGVLCGANNFTGTRNGNNFQFSFASNDPEPGCGITHGTVYNIAGTISGNELINGTFSAPDFGQSGVFNAKQTIRSTGRFFNDAITLDGDVYVDLALWSNSIAGYINFTGDPGDGALCGANSFTGGRNGDNISFSFLSSDPDAGCDIIDDERFDVTATISSNGLANGDYNLPTFGQGGTFTTDGPAIDTTAPSGAVTSPAPLSIIGRTTHTISTTATDGGTGVSHVNFRVKYNGSWHFLGTDPTPPYNAQWIPSANLNSQMVRFAIDVIDKSGNVTEDAGGQNLVGFIESIGSTVQENWIPAQQRAYLNQRSLPNGNVKCGAASVAMILAMNGLIANNYTSMAEKANLHYMPYNPFWYLKSTLQSYGLAIESPGCLPIDPAWEFIKTKIDEGHPLIILNSKFTAGHYFVIVGYRQEGTSRQIIAYDPYGKWAGSYNNYDPNGTSPDSQKGKWVYYDFDVAWGSGANCGLIMGYIPLNKQNASLNGGSPLTLPDEITFEPESIEPYLGEEIITTVNIFLPAIIKP